MSTTRTSFRHGNRRHHRRVDLRIHSHVHRRIPGRRIQLMAAAPGAARSTRSTGVAGEATRAEAAARAARLPEASGLRDVGGIPPLPVGSGAGASEATYDEKRDQCGKAARTSGGGKGQGHGAYSTSTDAT